MNLSTQHSYGNRDEDGDGTDTETHYGLNDPGIDSLWWQNFLCPSRLLSRPSQFPLQ
jgi:hypothetical protein